MKFKMKTDDGYETVYKIGLTTRPIRKRFTEVVMSMYNAYRYVPECDIRKYTKSDGYRQIEKEMHVHFSGSQVTMHDKVSGCTEFFKIEDEEAMIEKYVELIEKYKDYVEEVTEITNKLLIDEPVYSTMEPRVVKMAEPIRLRD